MIAEAIGKNEEMVNRISKREEKTKRPNPNLAKINKAIRKKEAEWTRLWTSTDNREVNKKPEGLSVYNNPLKKEKTHKKEMEWTRLGGATDDREVNRKPERFSVYKNALSRDLQESLRLAEERLRKEKENPKDEKEEFIGTKTKSNNPSDVNLHYEKAYNYYNKGEYSNALDAIRNAKKDYPEEPSLLKLEQSIKNKMKEERIKDHYNEGILYYQKNDFRSARKEFQSILNILPE